MIIGQVMRSFGGGGAQRAAVNLALGLAELGHESRLVALGEAGRFANDVAAIIPCDALRMVGAADVVLGAWQLRSAIARRRFDEIHIHGSGTLPVVVGILAGMRSPPAVHFTWHDSSSVLGGGGQRAAVVRWAMGRCASVSASSAMVAQRLQAAWGKGPVHVLRNGVPDLGISGSPEAAVPKVVWVGRLVPEKRPEWFLRAASAARRAGLQARFILAGSSLPRHMSYYRELRELSASLGEPVEFMGWVESPQELYRGAAIGVQTSATEGLSIALLEQMMARLAIVATDVGDTRIALDGGAAGVLVAEADECAFVAAILELIQDRGRRQHLADLARSRAVREFSCASMAKRCLALYGGAPR